MFLSGRTPAELALGLGLNPKEVGGKRRRRSKRRERGGEAEEKEGDSYSEESLRKGGIEI